MVHIGQYSTCHIDTKIIFLDQTKDGGMRRTQTLLSRNEIEEFLSGRYRTRIFK